MNFLEELTAQWYAYKGYYIIRNRTINILPGGGYEGEIDIIAYNPITNEVLHIETSSDSREWSERIKIFKEKFRWTLNEYLDLFGLPSSVKKIDKIAVVSFSINPREDNKTKFEKETGATLITVPKLLTMIVDSLKTTIPTSITLPENLPLLRLIQLVMRYGGLK